LIRLACILVVSSVDSLIISSFWILYYMSEGEMLGRFVHMAPHSTRFKTGTKTIYSLLLQDGTNFRTTQQKKIESIACSTTPKDVYTLRKVGKPEPELRRDDLEVDGKEDELSSSRH
jgi:hypothetical protein